MPIAAYLLLPASLSPKEEISWNSVSTNPGDMHVTRKGRSCARACTHEIVSTYTQARQQLRVCLDSAIDRAKYKEQHP